MDQAQDPSGESGQEPPFTGTARGRRRGDSVGLEATQETGPKAAGRGDAAEV